MLQAKDVIEQFDLKRHPEGGWYRETFRDDEKVDGRSLSTAIYYLLEAGDYSHWHRVDATEIWHYYAGSPMVITISPNGHDASAHRLGMNLHNHERPQIVVPKNHWQTAESLGSWTLVGCTVSPAFEFEGFEMAPDDWRPRPRSKT